jgi:hypothetical protein
MLFCCQLGGVKADMDKNNLQNEAEYVIFNTGGRYGPLDPDSDEGQRHANLYYEAIRNRTSDSDVKNIAANVNWPENVVRGIKRHVFLEEHNLDGVGVGRFVPDYEIAQAWDRLIQGNQTELDVLLLNHERLELRLMRRYGWDAEAAHIAANTRYNWSVAIKNS